MLKPIRRHYEAMCHFPDIHLPLPRTHFRTRDSAIYQGAFSPWESSRIMRYYTISLDRIGQQTISVRGGGYLPPKPLVVIIHINSHPNR